MIYMTKYIRHNLNESSLQIKLSVWHGRKNKVLQYSLIVSKWHINSNSYRVAYSYRSMLLPMSKGRYNMTDDNKQ